MKTFLKITGLLILLILIGSYVYWQKYKKGIFKYLIRTTINMKTDSLYYIRYDSSSIDEVDGNVYFRNVFLQSDSLQKVMLEQRDDLPNLLVNVYIESVTASGIDVQAALQKQELHASKIILEGPRILLTHTGSNTLKLEDTIAIYKKIIGDFNSINADSILIQHCTFISRNEQLDTQVNVRNASILLTKLKIDSTHDYSNVLSYFINHVQIQADTIHLKRKDDKGHVAISKINYNSDKRVLMIDRIESFSEMYKNSRTFFNKIQLNDMDAKAFIEQHQIQTGTLSSEGGVITVFTKKQSSEVKIKNQTFDFPEDFFDQINIGAIDVGKTDIMIRSHEFPDKEPITIHNVTFNVLNEIKVVQRKTIRQIISQANWELNSDGFSFSTRNKLYTILVKGIQLDKVHSSATISSISLRPNLSKEAFGKLVKKQTDYYSFELKNTRLNGINFETLLNESALDIQQVKTSIDLKVYNDRMLDVNSASKVGNYPQQQLLKIKMPFYIKQLLVENSNLSYTERAFQTKQTGELFFTQVQGSAENVTNIESRIKQNPVCILNGNGLFLGKGKASTQWKLMLNEQHGLFSMTGKIGELNAAVFNSMTKPLAMTSVRGLIHELSFSMKGNDDYGEGSLRFLYNDMQVESFKMDSESDTMKRNKVSSVINNMFLINNNPKNGVTRTPDFYSKREPNKSFFNLIWKSVFDGIQKTVMGERAAEMKKQYEGKK